MALEPTPPGIAFTAEQHAMVATWALMRSLRTEIDIAQAECEEVIWVCRGLGRAADLALYRDGDNGGVVALHNGAELAWGGLAHVLAAVGACVAREQARVAHPVG